MFDKFKKILTPLLIILLLLSIVVIGAPTYVNVGPTTDFEGDVGVPSGKGYYINDILFSTAGLIDISTLAKTDSNFIVGDGTNWIVESGATARASLGIDLTLYYLKTEIDTQGEVETIWGVTLSTDAERNALTYSDVGAIQDAANTIDSDKYVDGSIDHEHLAADIISGMVDVTSADEDYILIWDATDSSLKKCDMGEVRAGAGDMLKATYDTDEDNIVDKSETVDDGVGNSSTAADVKDAVTKKHSQNTDTDLDATFEATFVKKADTVNVLSDITSPGANIEDAVTKKHSQNTDTALGTQTQDLNMGTHKIIGVVDPVNPQEAATKAYADTKVATEVDPTVDSDAELKAILVDEVTKTGDFNAGRIAKINNASGIIEQGTNTDTEVADAVTKKHTAGADTTLGTMTADINMGTHKLTGLSVPSASGQSVRTTATITEANLEDAITKKHTQNTDTQFDFYNALSGDHDWSGDTDTQLVGESVVLGDLLYFNWADKEWKKSDADAAATVPGLRIALETKSDGQTCLMLVKGYIRDDSAFEFAGAMIYTSVTPGAMSSTAPTEAGDQIQRVGVAKSADILFFNPSCDVGEI